MKLNHFKNTLEVIFYDENYPTQNYYFIAPLQKKCLVMKNNLLKTLPYNLSSVLTGYDQTFFRTVVWELSTHEIFSFIP